jgi:hypothetical protein
VDPNLALDPQFGYGFGVGKSTKIILVRGDAWVWSNLWPKGVNAKSGNVDVDIHWKIGKSNGI